MSFANVLFAAICWFCSLIFGAISIWAFKRKDPMHFWSGTNVSPEEISDIPAYNRANGLMWGIYGACMALAGVISLFSIALGSILLVVIAIPGLVILIIVYKRIYNKYKSTSGLYKTNISTSNPKIIKATIIAAISITVVVAILVGALIYNGSKDPVIDILDSSIQINAMYGVNIDYSEIVSISLIEKSMSEIGIGIRTNGYGGIGETLKGHFKSENNGETLLFVQSKTAPTIRIERAAKKDVYVSFRGREKTEQLYRDMLAAPIKENVTVGG